MSSATLTMRAPHEKIVITPRIRGYSVGRYYDPATGQFISVDPAVDQTEAPYAYVNGDPVDAVDPFGLGLIDLLNPWSSNNPIRKWAASGSASSEILTFNPAFLSINGYMNEAWAWEHGCSLWTVAGYGLQGALGLADTGGIAFGGAGFVAGFIEGWSGAAAEDAFAEAAAGGRNAGFLRNYVGRSASELQRGVASLQRQIDAHLAKIADPAQAVGDWANLSSQEQAGLISKWQADIARQQAQQSILQDLLNGRSP